jgi:hypothetical protein
LPPLIETRVNGIELSWLDRTGQSSAVPVIRKHGRPGLFLLGACNLAAAHQSALAPHDTVDLGEAIR